jgi:hypothetical protein
VFIRVHLWLQALASTAPPWPGVAMRAFPSLPMAFGRRGGYL